MFKLTTTWMHDGSTFEKVFDDFTEMVQHILNTPSYHLGMVNFSVEPTGADDYPDLPRMAIVKK